MTVDYNWESGMPTLAKKWDGKVPEIPTFEETDSGRRRRGELELYVDYAVKYYLVEDSESTELCTCEYIARLCESIDGKNTSSNAVWRTLLKWEEIGYCTTATGPNRFEFFTDDGLLKGLDELYRLHKRAVRREKDRDIRERVKIGGRTRSGKRIKNGA